MVARRWSEAEPEGIRQVDPNLAAQIEVVEPGRPLQRAAVLRGEPHFGADIALIAQPTLQIASRTGPKHKSP